MRKRIIMTMMMVIMTLTSMNVMMMTLMIILAMPMTTTSTLLMLSPMAIHLQRPVLTSLHAIPARAPRGPTVSVPLASSPPPATGWTSASNVRLERKGFKEREGRGREGGRFERGRRDKGRETR